MLTAQEIADELERTIPVMQGEAETAMHAAVEVGQRAWAEAAPGGSAGRVARTTTSVRKTSTGVSGSVRPKTPEDRLIAGYLDRGTGLWRIGGGDKRPITPRPPHKALKWADGRIRGSSRGVKPREFIEKAKAAAEVEVEDILTGGARKASERLFR